MDLNSLPLEILEYVLLFALPISVPPSPTTFRLAPLRSCMIKTAEWRLVNYRWRDLMDRPNTSIWYHLALFLKLEPPRQLYAGGTYRQVCEYLLKAEVEKNNTIMEVDRRNNERGMVACGISWGEPERPKNHPQPEKDVKLTPQTKTRIAENAKALESFLKSLDYCLNQFQQDSWSESALLRYRMFLHLKVTHPDVWLVPTVDIEFCWLAHIFRTETYWKDMKTLGTNPEHSLCLDTYGQVVTFSQAVRATETLWNRTFGGGYPYLASPVNTSVQVWQVAPGPMFSYSLKQEKPYSFFPVMGAMISFSPPFENNLPTVSIRHADIAADLKWFPELEQAFNDLYTDNYYAYTYGHHGELIEKQIIPSYERFLDLCRRDGVTNPAPPYVLDLVWHAHQLEPAKYKRDCLELFGREFWHNPWPHGLGKSTPVSAEFECRWKDAFGTRMADDWKFFLES